MSIMALHRVTPFSTLLHRSLIPIIILTSHSKLGNMALSSAAAELSRSSSAAQDAMSAHQLPFLLLTQTTCLSKRVGARSKVNSTCMHVLSAIGRDCEVSRARAH